MDKDLADAALQEILQRGAPILGSSSDFLNHGELTEWMSLVPDETKLVHMNLPGTHDACTWNYTAELQASLEKYTGPIPDSRVFRCQQRSLFRMLNDGIRVFDLRYAWNPGCDTIGFYHSPALLSPTTRMEDVFFGFYHWLQKHPTEAVLISLNYEPATGRSDDARLQEKLYEILTSPLAKNFWVQKSDLLGTLGEARGKLILIQRFDYNLLPANRAERFGIHLDPRHWIVNGKFIELTYDNKEERQVAYIQDHYRIELSTDSNPTSCIRDKFQVVTEHIERAIDSNLHRDQLFISFASAAFRIEEMSLTPEIYALGDHDTGLVGLNARLLDWLKDRQGKRLGIIFFDFYDAVPGLVEAIIGQRSLSRY